MEAQEQTKLTFIGVDIIDIDYRFGKTPVGSNVKLNLKTTGCIYYPKNDKKLFQIILNLELQCEDNFYIKIGAVGKFSFDKEISEELKNGFVNSNAPAIVFPYLRAFVATLTANLGSVVKPINLPPQFFTGELKEISEDDLKTLLSKRAGDGINRPQ